MATDPSSLFLAAALAAGVVEGSSVIRYHRQALLQQSNFENSDGNTNTSDGNAAIPSMSIITAHLLLYGVASVPLGIVGASPGLAFLPKSLSASINKNCDDGDAAVAHEEAIHEVDKRVVENALNDLPPTASDTHILGSTGRGMGRILRHENSKKMTHNKRQRHTVEVESANRNNITATRSPARNINSSRFIATLDGAHLPTQLAEAMRRSRCIFIGAGLVSYVLTQYCLSDRSSHSVGNYQYQLFEAEGIKNGKHINGVESLRQLRNDIAQQQDTSGSISHDVSSKILSNDNTVYTAFDIIYNAAKWINIQLGRDSDEPDHWRTNKTIDTSRPREVNPSIAENNNLDNQEANGGVAQKPNDAKTSSSTPDSKQSQNSHVWDVAVTSVDVLGTSIRHLLVSPYRIASAVANLGRNGQEETSEESTTQHDGKVSNDPENSAANDSGMDNNDNKSNY